MVRETTTLKSPAATASSFADRVLPSSESFCAEGGEGTSYDPPSAWFTGPSPVIRGCGWCLDTALHNPGEGVPTLDASVDMGAMGLEYRWACSWHALVIGEDWFGAHS